MDFVNYGDILVAMSEYLEFAKQIAEDAGVLLTKSFYDEDLNRSIKSDKSVVTEADLASDRMITTAIKDNFPGDLILSEESRVQYEGEKECGIWIVDPLDGTTNFSLGLTIWGVLVTRIQNGYPTTAVLNFPLLDEIYTSEAGKGAFLNGKRIDIDSVKTDDTLPFFVCCSRTFRRYEVNIPYKMRILGSAAYSFCLLLRGSAILSFETSPKIWDIAGSWLLVKEAGGTIDTITDEKPFPIHSGIDYSRRQYPTLGAKNRQSWIQARNQIK